MPLDGILNLDTLPCSTLRMEDVGATNQRLWSNDIGMFGKKDDAQIVNIIFAYSAHPSTYSASYLLLQ